MRVDADRAAGDGAEIAALEDEIIYGQHAVSALLDTAAERVREVWLQRDRDNRLSRRLHSRYAASPIPVHVLPRARLDEMFEGARHQGVVVRATAAAAPDLRQVIGALSDDTLLVLLDGVQDPHNLGAVVRSAAAAGAAAVIHPRSRGVGLTAAARKAAAGAAERIPVVPVPNLARAMGELADAGVVLVGLDAQAPGTLWHTDLTGRVALVLGAEAEGLRRLTREACHVLTALPMAASVESLNVSVAAGVCLFEARRQRAPAGESAAAS